MEKKIDKKLVIVFVIWFVISVIAIVVSKNINSVFLASFGGVLIGSWLCNFIKCLIEGQFYW